MPQLSVNGTTVNFHEKGSGTPLVLLHGFPLDSRIWREQVGALSDRFRVITPDLRGFGQSKSNDAFTMESLADDVHALLADVGASPSVLGGLSMGGYVALAYAKKYPTKGSAQWVRGFAEAHREATTLELVPDDA